MRGSARAVGELVATADECALATRSRIVLYAAKGVVTHRSRGASEVDSRDGGDVAISVR